MSNYRVLWEIDAEDADSPLAAARRARAAQTNPDSIASVFTVIDVDTGEKFQIDLDDAEVNPVAPKDRLIADITAELDAEDADEEE